MFSENDIVMQCRQCRGQCDDLIKCPLKINWPVARTSRIFPAIPGKWKFSDAGKCVYIPAVEKFTTEELITGLDRLNSHF